MRNTTKVLLTVALSLIGGIPLLTGHGNALTGMAGIAGVCMLVSVARSVYSAAAENHRAASFDGGAADEG
jgi:hypothetical protein